MDRGRIDEGLETGELDLRETHEKNDTICALAFLRFSPLRSSLPSRPSKRLETFANPARERDYRIHMEIPEFTCLCPKTGQPDFATLVLDYIPDRLCVELKSLKLYVWSYRDEGAFHEAVTNRILDDLVRATKPRFMKLEARFNVRGGIYTTVVAEHRKKGWRGELPAR
ncbi:MAG TPA: preQ(1) synthase [Anaerolineales bacterium]